MVEGGVIACSCKAKRKQVEVVVGKRKSTIIIVKEKLLVEELDLHGMHRETWSECIFISVLFGC